MITNGQPLKRGVGAAPPSDTSVFPSGTVGVGNAAGDGTVGVDGTAVVDETGVIVRFSLILCDVISASTEHRSRATHGVRSWGGCEDHRVHGSRPKDILRGDGSIVDGLHEAPGALPWIYQHILAYPVAPMWTHGMEAMTPYCHPFQASLSPWRVIASLRAHCDQMDLNHSGMKTSGRTFSVRIEWW